MTITTATQETVYGWILSLMPKGQAWGTHDITNDPSVSMMRSFWNAAASVVVEADAAIVDTLLEFFCATAVDDVDLWQQDYGVPDECDPTGESACVIATSGTGQSLAFYQSIAEALGYSADMQWIKGSRRDGDPAYDGVYSTLYVNIDSASSAIGFVPLTIDTWTLGLDMPLGDPDFGGLECVLDRIVPAHVAVIVEIDA